MSTPLKIFLTGATGYIGGSVLLRFLEHQDAATFKLTALVRSQEKADKLKAFGVNVVLGSLEDASLLEDLAADADVVISTADCDDVPAIQAILAGAQRYHAKNGPVPTLIHTSGTGVIADSAAGEYLPETEIYDDLNTEQIESLPFTQQHRPVDLEIVKADKERYVKTYIVLPSTIYGRPRGPLAKQNIQNPYSIQIPSLIEAALGRGRGGMVGPGQNFWPNVHVDDVADLYITIFNLTRHAPEAVAHGREGFYFAENGEHTLYQVGKAIAEALIIIGKGVNPEPSTFTDEEIKKYFGGSTFWGTNSRCLANRSRAVGWKPTKTTSDMLASIFPEVEERSLKGSSK